MEPEEPEETNIIIGNTHLTLLFIPRPLCIDETTQTKTEVAKLFLAPMVWPNNPPNSYIYSSKFIINLNQITLKDTEVLTNCAILPLRICDIKYTNKLDTTHLDIDIDTFYNTPDPNSPETPPKQLTRYYMRSQMYGPSFHPRMLYPKMIIYKRCVGLDVKQLMFAKMQPINFFILKYTGVLKGIQILQKYNFIHNDIKPENCMEDDDFYKIIDFDTCFLISEINARLDFIIDKTIYYLSPTYDYLLHFLVKTKNMETINPQYIKKKRGRSQLFNSKSYTHITTKPYMSTELISKFKQILKTLFDQSSIYFYIKNTDNSVKNIETFHEIFIKNNYTDAEEKKSDLLKRNDIYSFGICILELLLHNNSTNKQINSNIINIIDLCCIQRAVVADINEIYKLYCEIVIPLFDLSEFSRFKEKYGSIIDYSELDKPTGFGSFYPQKTINPPETPLKPPDIQKMDRGFDDANTNSYLQEPIQTQTLGFFESCLGNNCPRWLQTPKTEKMKAGKKQKTKKHSKKNKTRKRKLFDKNSIQKKQ